MIVEFIGPSGAGKSTLIREVQRLGAPAGRSTVSIGELVMDRPARRWVSNPKAVNVITDLTVLPSFVRSPASRPFARFAFDRLRRHAPTTFAKVKYFREVVRDVGKHELARRLEEDRTVLVDEGALLTAYHLFVYSLGPVDDAELERYAQLVPLPDRVVSVTAPLDVLVDRATRRPDRRRELATANPSAVASWISRAVDVFERLVAIPSIGERTLVVENTDAVDPRALAATVVERLSLAADLEAVAAPDVSLGGYR
jgi:AAA domain